MFACNLISRAHAKSKQPFCMPCGSLRCWRASRHWARSSSNDGDGSEAEISGNGTRCVAAYLCSEQPKERFAVRTDAGVKTCMLTSHSESTYEFEIAMGKPRVGDEFPIKLAFGEVRGIPVSMGNP